MALLNNYAVHHVIEKYKKQKIRPSFSNYSVYLNNQCKMKAIVRYIYMSAVKLNKTNKKF